MERSEQAWKKLRKRSEIAQKKPHPCKRLKDGPPKFKGNVTSNVKGKFKGKFKGNCKGVTSDVGLRPSYGHPVRIIAGAVLRSR